LPIFEKQKPTSMSRFFLSIILLFGSIVIFAQANTNITVYSTSGKVDLISGKSSRQLKSYDLLTAQAIINFLPNSKLYFISADNKMHEFSKSGKFTVSKIIASVKNTPSEMSNAMSLIIHHFIEKGKSYHGKLNYNTAGVVTRGGSEKLMLFPVYNSTILFQHKIVPVFNPKLIDSNAVIQIDLMVNDVLKNNYQIKNGEAFDLPDDLKSSDEVYLKLTNDHEPEQIKLSIVNEQKKNAITKDMAQLETDFNSEDAGNLLLAKALFFESKGFNVDALDCYNQLIQLSGNDANYIEQKNVFLKEVTQ